MTNKIFDLDQRLISFAVAVIDLTEDIPRTLAGSHMAGQLVRSGTAPALQYGEAQAGESRTDFIHKMKIALKELRESYNCLRIVQAKRWIEQNRIAALLQENNELISIFFASIDTARKNNSKIERKRERISNIEHSLPRHCGGISSTEGGES